MKKLLLNIVCLVALFAAGTSLKAQEITITLDPGWNWISYPNAVEMEVNEALATFTPMEGDMVKGPFGFATYYQGQWTGGLTHFIPGMGYIYCSLRTETTSFVFAQASSSVVETATPTDITATSAVVGGTVTLPEGSHVFLRGVCWGTEPNPDIDGNHTTEGTGIGSFNDTLEGLNPDTTYYVRAYAVSDYGLAYGNEVSFYTEVTQTWQDGILPGHFSVDETRRQVQFSQGNLQYQASTNTWRFADNQWDFVGGTDEQGRSLGNVSGSTNSLISSSYSGWIDLFGWGTSGYNHGAICYQPWSSSVDPDNYMAYGLWYANLNSQTGQADWGYNAISNGGNTVNQWHTLTQNEWRYMLERRRTTSGIRYAKAQVNGVNGLIILPDNWSSSTYSLSGTNNDDVNFSSNIITATQWTTLESAGAVFLPAAGIRYGTEVWFGNECLGTEGYYWSATVELTSDTGDYSGLALNVCITENAVGDNTIDMFCGLSVRLVRFSY